MKGGFNIVDTTVYKIQLRSIRMCRQAADIAIHSILQFGTIKHVAIHASGILNIKFYFVRLVMLNWLNFII